MTARGEAAYALSVDIGAHHVRTLLADLRETEVIPRFEEPSGATNLSKNPRDALEMVTKEIKKTLLAGAEKLNVDELPLAGLAISLPFPVNPSNKHPSSPAWRRVQLPSDLWTKLRWTEKHGFERPMKAAVESDAHLGAVAELDAAVLELDLNRERTDMAYVKWSTSLSGAAIAQGKIHRGFRGMAGAWVHTPMGDPHAERCTYCGRVCLSSTTSLTSMIRRTGREPKELGESAEVRAPKLIELAQTDPAVRDVVIDAARSLGRGIGLAINVLNPKLVIVGGAFHTEEYEYLSEDVEHGIDETALPQISETSMVVQSGRRTGEAAVRGGISHALREFSADYLLGASRPSD